MTTDFIALLLYAGNGCIGIFYHLAHRNPASDRPVSTPVVFHENLNKGCMHISTALQDLESTSALGGLY